MGYHRKRQRRTRDHVRARQEEIAGFNLWPYLARNAIPGATPAAALFRVDEVVRVVEGPFAPLHGAIRAADGERRPFRPSRAMCGQLLVGKSFVHGCSSGRSSHVFGLLVRFT